MKKQYTFKNTCRVCGGKKFIEVLNLGNSPLANAFLSKTEIEKPELKFPLVVYLCTKCKLVGLRHVVKPEILFKDYHYLTSASAPLSAHFKKLAEEVANNHIKSKNDLVVEIGSNDGDLLSNLLTTCRVLGVDPADNIAKIAKKRGVKTLTAFFTKKTAKEIVKKYGHAQVILANNVLAHIDTIGDVFSGVATVLEKDGKCIFETHWVGNLLGDGGFDQIYHEHLCYFSLHTISYLVKQYGLKVLDISLVPIHGESLRVTVGKSGKPASSVKLFLEKEKKLGLDKNKAYLEFTEKVEKNKKNLVGLLQQLKQEGKKIIGYGAPAKGNTLLNYCDITPNILDFITDTTPLKQGLFTPGAHIPVVPPEMLLSNQPDYILLLSWNYADAILKKETTLRQGGVKFIIPVPKVKVL